MANENENEEFEYNVEPSPVQDPDGDSADLDGDERELADTQHEGNEPSEADYEKARTVGIGNEPELPPGVVRKR